MKSFKALLLCFLTSFIHNLTAGPELSLNLSYGIGKDGEAFVSTSHFLHHPNLRLLSKGPTILNSAEKNIVAGDDLSVRFLILERSPLSKSRLPLMNQAVKARVFYSLNNEAPQKLEVPALSFDRPFYWSKSDTTLQLRIPTHAQGELKVWGEVEKADGTRVVIKDENTQEAFRFEVIANTAASLQFTHVENEKVQPELKGVLKPGEGLSLNFDPQRLQSKQVSAWISFRDKDGEEIESLDWYRIDKNKELVLKIPGGTARIFTAFYVELENGQARYDRSSSGQWYYLFEIP